MNDDLKSKLGCALMIIAVGLFVLFAGFAQWLSSGTLFPPPGHY
jgi:hypothetical protein